MNILEVTNNESLDEYLVGELKNMAKLFADVALSKKLPSSVNIGADLLELKEYEDVI